jgi:hypothetical protein
MFLEPPGMVNEPPHAWGQKKSSVPAVPFDRTTRIRLWTWLKSTRGLPPPSVNAAAAEMHAWAKATLFVGAKEFAGQGVGIALKLPLQLVVSATYGTELPTRERVNAPCETSS